MRDPEDGDEFFCKAVAGKTETSAPLSMRKEDLLLLSHTDKEPEITLMEEPGAFSARPGRFPRTRNSAAGKNTD